MSDTETTEVAEAEAEAEDIVSDDELANMTDEERAVMEQWGDIAEEEVSEDGEGDEGVFDGGDENARVLSQEEIDSLLGFDDNFSDMDENSGIMALINAALVNYERLPMLDIVFDRLVRLMSTSLRNLTSDNVDVSLDQVSTVRFGDYMNSVPLPALLSVFKAEEWDNYGLLVTDSALIYSIVDVLLGGRKGTPTTRVEGRPYTTIETKLVERMVSVGLGDLSSAFDPLSPVNFALERMETNPRFTSVTQPNSACVLARLRVDMGDRGGRMEIVIPYATLEPIRELLLQMFMGEKFGRDSIWESHLTKELYQTDIKLQAILGEKIVQLSSLLNWRVGETIVFNTKMDDEMELRCGDFSIFKGPVGRREEKISVRIDSYVDPEKEQ